MTIKAKDELIIKITPIGSAQMLYLPTWIMKAYGMGRKDSIKIRILKIYKKKIKK